jgi:hypothetical protein
MTSALEVPSRTSAPEVPVFVHALKVAVYVLGVAANPLRDDLRVFLLV